MPVVLPLSSLLEEDSSPVSLLEDSSIVPLVVELSSHPMHSL